MAIVLQLLKCLHRALFPGRPVKVAEPTAAVPTIAVANRPGGSWAGEIVQDRDVVGDYPHARSQQFKTYDWPKDEIIETTLAVFGPSSAVVTMAYLSIDPERGRLFLNHGYNGVRLLYPPVNNFLGETDFRLETGTAKTVSGRVIVIGGPYDRLYFHWLLSWCLRFTLVEMLAPELYADPSVRFLIDKRAAEEPYRSFLPAFGIDESRVIWVDDQEGPYVIDEAIQATLPNELHYYPELIKPLADRIRNGLPTAPRPGVRRRLWISRQALEAPRRRISNMEAVSPVLARFGIEEVILEHLPVHEQVRAFAEAEFIGGVHGAGLVNMIFSPPDVRVLVVEKDFNRLGGLDHYFSGLAKVCGLSWQMIYATTPPLEGIAEPTIVDLHLQDVEVDPKMLAKALGQMLG